MWAYSAFEMLSRCLGRSPAEIARMYYGAVKTRAYEARYQGNAQDRTIRADALRSARASMKWARSISPTEDL